jgi:hypothetical protein
MIAIVGAGGTAGGLVGSRDRPRTWRVRRVNIRSLVRWGSIAVRWFVWVRLPVRLPIADCRLPRENAPGEQSVQSGQFVQ